MGTETYYVYMLTNEYNNVLYIGVTNNLARVNYDNCIQCGKCAEKCPSKVITNP